MNISGVHTITKGDTLEPLNTILLKRNGTPYDLSAYTVKFFMETDTGTSEIAETTTGVTAHPTQAFTADASTDLLSCDDHGVEEGDQIEVASSTALPTGLSASTRYFAVNVTPNSFSLATRPGGAAIDITSAGSGTHTFWVVGSVQFDFLAANVDTAGIYYGFFTLTSSSEKLTVPHGNQPIEVRIVEAGN